MTAFAALLRPPASVTTVEAPGAGHSFGAWRQDMPGALDWLGDTIGGPQPAGRLAAGVVVRVRPGVAPPRLPAVPQALRRA